MDREAEWLYTPLKLGKTAPENGWLEDDPALLLGQKAYFQGLLLLVLGSVVVLCPFWAAILVQKYRQMNHPTWHSRSWNHPTVLGRVFRVAFWGLVPARIIK